MRNDRIVSAYANVKPDAETRERMIANILAQRKDIALSKRRKKLPLLCWAMPAACAAAVLLLVVAAPQFQPAVESPEVLQQVAPGADSPSGMRKFMNYDGLRYAFLENGASYDLEADQLSQPLGTLEYDIGHDPETYGTMEFAATFAVGGTIYEMEGYDPRFRLAVKMDGCYYICQSVDTVDNTGLELDTYFETAHLQERVESILICDHAGRESLAEVSDQEVLEMLSVISGSARTELTDEQYQQVGRAQRTGGSFLLQCRMNDGTAYQMYVIPSLSIVMAGDSMYVLPHTFSEEFGSIFDGLEQRPAPMG